MTISDIAKRSNVENSTVDHADPVEMLVEHFLPMAGWKDYLSRVQRARLAAGLRELARMVEEDD